MHDHGDIAALFASMTPAEQEAVLADLPPAVVEVILESLPVPVLPEPSPSDAFALLRTLHPDDVVWAVGMTPEVDDETP